eukprot:g3414.t1
MSDNFAEQQSKEVSQNHEVDGAILDTKSRLSLFKDQLVNLSYEVSRSSELDVALSHSNGIRSNNRITTVSSGGLMDAPVTSPRSSIHSADAPAAETADSTPRAESSGLQPRLEETNPSWRTLDDRVQELETYSEDQDCYHSMLELHEGSSSSSRSWSVGKSIGFGPNGTDLILRNDSVPTTGCSHHRRFDSPFRSELYSLQPSPPIGSRTTSTCSFGDSSRKDGGGGGGNNSVENWILSSILPVTCWPKEELTDVRWTSMKGQNQPSSKPMSSGKQGMAKMSKINHAVRSAIGKIWDEYSSETAHNLYTLLNNFLTTESSSKIDPQSCWISGRAISAAANGLPFAFTIHTCSSLCKPCISGHANVTVEVSSLDSENADVFEKALQEYEQRAYGVSSNSSFSLPEPNSPYREEMPNSPPHWPASSRQLISPDFETGPLFPIHEQGEELVSHQGQDRRQTRKDSRTRIASKDAGSESVSTFSFNSITQDKRDQDNPASGSSDTFSTADLSTFIRHGHHQQHRQGIEGTQSPESSSKDRTGPAQRTVFSELDLIWEMHYPDFEKLETVIASRKFQRNEEQQIQRDVTSQRATYIGDTDSELSDDLEPNSSVSASRELVVHEDAPSPEHDLTELASIRRQSSESTQLVRHRHEMSFDRESDPWDGVIVPYQDSKQDSRKFDLTDSMEVNFDDDRNRRWGRIHKLSSFVRRVKRLIGTSSSSTDSRRGPQTLSIKTIEAIQESPEPEERMQYYSPDPSTPSDHRPSRSPSGGARSTEGFQSALSTESEQANPDAVVSTGDPSLRPRSSPTESSLVLKGSSSFPSSIVAVGQNVSWDESRSVKLPVKDLGDGRYLALGHLTGLGRYQISVKIGNRKITDQSIVSFVVESNSLGSGITNQGPFYQRPDSAPVTSASTVPVPHPNFPPCHSVSYDSDRLEYASRHPHLGFVDILIIVDCTLGMDRELQQLPTVLQSIEDLSKDSVLLKRLKMGVIAYRDHDPDDEDTFLLRKQGLTEDLDKVRGFLSGLEAVGAGDYPEAMEVAFAEAVDGIKWSSFSSRFILWIGDAPPHGYQGFTHKRALEEEHKFKAAKTRLKKAARAVELAMKNEESAQQISVHDQELADALAECDAIDKYHDKYPLGVPGGVRWEETVERLSSLGVRVLVLGLRDAIAHEASRNCLRTIAHISGGALLEVVTLDSSVIAPLIVAIIEQALDHQLLEEEVCDLILCSKNDFEHQSLEDKRRNLVESMSQAAKQPHRLQVAPKGSFSDGSGASKVDHEMDQVAPYRTPRSDSRISIGCQSSRHSSGSVGPLTISGGSFDLHSSSSSSAMDSRALLLGMISVRFDDEVLEQILRNLRSKSEIVGDSLLKNFESVDEWFDFHLCHVADAGLYKGQRQRILGLTTPLAIRYILALQTMAQEERH